MIQLGMLMVQCYPFGLALLVFAALRLYEKLTSMGMPAAPLCTSVDIGAATAATEAQWNTVLFWMRCLAFVGLVVLSKHLLDFVKRVNHDEPMLPVCVAKQQQPSLAQHSRDRATRKLFVAEPMKLQLDSFDSAAGTAQLDPTFCSPADQPGWTPGGVLSPTLFLDHGRGHRKDCGILPGGA